MFDFIFKRRTKKPEATPVAVAATSVTNVEAEQAVQERRRAALHQLDGLKHDEAAVVTFLLACDFADGRFQAAHYVQSPEQLRSVLQAMRNSDKRVSRLMQTRLDAQDQAQRLAQAAQQCIAHAEKLLRQFPLLSNQLTELDKQAAHFAKFPDDLQNQYKQLRQSLESRLLAQTSLQRKLLDLLSRAQDQTDLDAAMLGRLQAELAEGLQHAEVSSLPKNLVHDLNLAVESAQLTVKRQQDALAAQAAHELARQLADEQAAEQAAQAVARRAAEQLAVKPEDASASSGTAELPEVLIEQNVVENEATRSTTPAATTLPSISKEQVLHLLQDMEDALAAGSVQLALKADKELRAADWKMTDLHSKQKDRLQRIRAELNHLRDWARWGGSVSRDELIKAAEDLPKQELAPNELAKKVGGLRERWKSLEATTGAANKDIWQRFDAACNVAYAAASAYFQQLAEERKANFAKAKIQLSELQAQAILLQENPVDWKKIAQVCNQFKNAWRELGVIDRKQRTALDKEFDVSFEVLFAPLQQQRRVEIQAREELIQQVHALDPEQRNSVDQLRQLQETWQQRAVRLPLLRKDEQNLWSNFRQACDALFAERRAVTDVAQQQRHENLVAKQALCTELETHDVARAGEITQLLRDVQARWHRINEVPRQEEVVLEQRFRQALNVLEKKLQALDEENKRAQQQAILSKFELCQTLEKNLQQAVVDPSQVETAQQSWSQLPALPTQIDKPMQQRWTRALTALVQNDQGYVQTLRANQTEFDQQLLQMEIMLSLPSPAELAQQRLATQVAVLQNSLKAGKPHSTKLDGALALLSLPACLDDGRTHRLLKVLEAAQ